MERGSIDDFGGADGKEKGRGENSGWDVILKEAFSFCAVLRGGMLKIEETE